MKGPKPLQDLEGLLTDWGLALLAPRQKPLPPEIHDETRGLLVCLCEASLLSSGTWASEDDLFFAAAGRIVCCQSKTGDEKIESMCRDLLESKHYEKVMALLPSLLFRSERGQTVFEWFQMAHPHVQRPRLISGFASIALDPAGPWKDAPDQQDQLAKTLDGIVTSRSDRLERDALKQTLSEFKKSRTDRGKILGL